MASFANPSGFASALKSSKWGYAANESLMMASTMCYQGLAAG